MWLMTEVGFFSIVCKPDDKKAGTLTVRARAPGDLEALRDRVLPTLGAIIENAGTDYRFRAKAPRADVAKAAAACIEGLTYSNFKSRVEECQGHQRANVYSRVWKVLLDLEQAPKPKQKPVVAMSSGKAAAWGGIVVDPHGRVLLRRPAGHYDGYVWTFPKGRPDPGETPEQAALREVREETGVEATVVGAIAGEFAGGTTVNRYFRMAPVHDHGDFDRKETTEVCWVTLAEAQKRIYQTTNATGRARDLAVLAAVQALVESGADSA